MGRRNLASDLVRKLQEKNPDTARVTVPDYAPEAPDISSLNLNLDEGSSLVVYLKRATDKNPEDNPVPYTGVTSFE